MGNVRDGELGRDLVLHFLSGTLDGEHNCAGLSISAGDCDGWMDSEGGCTCDDAGTVGRRGDCAGDRSEAVNNEAIALHQAGKFAEAIPLAGRYTKAKT